ncbi:MAG TPA: hypothetical protein VJX66_12105 [Amycolatopsis sp.]|nr:hypothetical protein [Amycolatopsis sp.]
MFVTVCVTVNSCPGWTVVALTSTALDGGAAFATGADAQKSVAAAASEDRIVVRRHLRCIVVISLFSPKGVQL